ncbi:MAG: hypothetical protein JWM68_3548 [Verrucomicrobiales bacterium]|nr:hypothetical protein [Verrucomicrobiales bacterium]
MAKNRRAESAAVRFGPAIKAFLLCFLIGGSAIGYVWEKNQINYWGEQIKKSENKLSELRTQNKIRADQLSALTSPVALDARVKRMNLGLVQPSLSQVLRVVEVFETANAVRDTRYAEQPAMQSIP